MSTWGLWFENMFIKPIGIYLVWLVGYGIVNFVLTSKVAKYECDSSYRTFTTNPALRKKVEWLPIPMELIFLLSHFTFYLIMHLWAVLLFHSFYLNVLACFFWSYWSFFQGANYYMDYFAKKYETQLQKLS